MLPIDFVDEPPPVPPKSPLRNLARLSTASIHSLQAQSVADSNSSTYALPSRSIGNLTEQIRPRYGLQQNDNDSLRPPYPMSGSSYSSTYSLDLSSFPVPPSTRPNTSHHQESRFPQSFTCQKPLPPLSKAPTSSISLTSPTSSHLSYSSSRPVSTASTHTVYSATGTPPADEKPLLLGFQKQGPSTLVTPPEGDLPTHQPILAMIEQLSPIIYQESTWPMTEPTYSHSYSRSDPTFYGDAYINSYTLVDEDVDQTSHSLFPPHPGVRPPAARKQPYTSIEPTGLRKQSIGAMVPAVATSLITMARLIPVPKRRSSLRFGRRLWRS